jgi:ribose transport system permease protein/putative xylitol transport system permease protein
MHPDTPERGRKNPLAWFRSLSTEAKRTVVSVAFLAVLYIVIGLIRPVAFSPNNLSAMLQSGSILLLVSLGATFVVMMGMIDLSVGSLVTLAGMSLAVLYGFIGDWAIPVAMLITIVVGIVNGSIVAFLRLPSFLVTLGTLSIIAGFALVIGNSYVSLSSPLITAVTLQRFGGIPIAMVWAAIVVVILSWIAVKTLFGRGAYAIGGNERVALIAGVPVRRYKITAFALSALTASMAGIILVGQLGAGSPTIGQNLLLDSVAAIAVGGTALTGGHGGPWATVIGAAIMTVVSNALVVLQVDANIQGIVKGAIVIVAVYFTMDRKRGLIVK